jgi:hypothetical protein
MVASSYFSAEYLDVASTRDGSLVAEALKRH